MSKRTPVVVGRYEKEKDKQYYSGHKKKLCIYGMCENIVGKREVHAESGMKMTLVVAPLRI